jgi:hypothetical protein
VSDIAHTLPDFSRLEDRQIHDQISDEERLVAGPVTFDRPVRWMILGTIDGCRIDRWIAEVIDRYGRPRRIGLGKQPILRQTRVGSGYR